MSALPPTAAALLAVLQSEGGTIDYRDPRVTTSGLTALRHRGLARVVSGGGRPAVVVIVEAVAAVHGASVESGRIAPRSRDVDGSGDDWRADAADSRRWRQPR